MAAWYDDDYRDDRLEARGEADRLDGYPEAFYDWTLGEGEPGEVTRPLGGRYSSAEPTGNRPSPSLSAESFAASGLRAELRILDRLLDEIVRVA